jgi:hypothetical protein
MQFVAKGRAWLALHPWVHWTTVAALALGAGYATWGSQQRLDAAKHEWGDAVDVYVAVSATDAGEPLLTTVEQWPRALVPDAAAMSVDDDARARRPVGAGELITQADIRPTGTGALVPDGWVAVMVEATSLSHFAEGAAVRLFADGLALADGTVVSVHDTSVLVAVPPDGAATVALAAGDGRAVVGVIGG